MSHSIIKKPRERNEVGSSHFSFGPFEMYSPILTLSSFSDDEYKKKAIDSGVAGVGTILNRSSSAIHSLSRELSLKVVDALARRLCSHRNKSC